MSVYYVAGIPYSNELYHHGVKGQKWGVRRYVNPDGTLTAEGRKRYGTSSGVGKYANKNSLIRRLASGEWSWGVKGYADDRELTLKQKIEKMKKRAADGKSFSQKKLDSLTAEYKRQREDNIKRNKYISNVSTGKLLVQRLLLGTYGAAQYRNDRSEGDSWVTALDAAKAVQERYDDPGSIAWYRSRHNLAR